MTVSLNLPNPELLTRVRLHCLWGIEYYSHGGSWTLNISPWNYKSRCESQKRVLQTFCMPVNDSIVLLLPFTFILKRNLCCPGWSQTHGRPPVSASQVLCLHTCVILFGLDYHFFFYILDNTGIVFKLGCLLLKRAFLRPLVRCPCLTWLWLAQDVS